MGKFPIFAEGPQPHFYFWATALQVWLQNLCGKGKALQAKYALDTVIFIPWRWKWSDDLYCSCLKTGGWQKIVKSQQLSASDPDLPQLKQLWLRPWTWTRHAIVAATVSRWDFPCLHVVVQQTTPQFFFKFQFWEHVIALLVHCPWVKSFKGSGQIFFLAKLF